MKEEGKTSKAPLSESFGQWKNGKIVLLALLGLTAGQGVVWYTGQFYALFFLTAQLKVDADDGAADDRRVAAPRHAVLHRLRHALRPDRQQADHHGRLPDRRADLLPAVQGAHRGGQPRRWPPPRRRTRSSSRPIPAQCSFQGSPIAREIDFKTLVRHRQALPGAELGELRQRRRAGRHAGHRQDRRQDDHAAGGDRRQPEVRRRQHRQGRRLQEGDDRRPGRRGLSRPRPSRSAS